MHPLVEAVAATLPRPAPRDTPRYLALLDGRLAALAAGRWPAPAEEADRAVARRFLHRVHARWHDGDENVVRGLLDRWSRGDDHDAARRIHQAALALVAQSARPETLWFFLWELESVLESETA